MFYILISPAKKLADHCEYKGETTQIVFKKDVAELIALLKKKAPNDIASLMHISDKLAHLNYIRFQEFNPRAYIEKNSMPALFMFQGHCYQGLKADSFSKQDIAFAQKSLGILSGLYGLLSPLDLVQPYRLEMSVLLSNSRGKDLYAFWSTQLVKAINKNMEKCKANYLLNLASNEYFSAINTAVLSKPVVKIDFKESRNGKLKIIGINAKKARGMMVNFIVKNRCKTLESLQDFSGMSYQYSPSLSSGRVITFVR